MKFELKIAINFIAVTDLLKFLKLYLMLYAMYHSFNIFFKWLFLNDTVS